MKSLARAPVGPFAPNTLTVHEMASFTRTTVVDALTCPTHDSTDAVVGTPNTPNVNGLPLTAPLLDVKSSVTWNVVVDALVCPTHASTDAVVADDTLNENALPPEITAPLDDSCSVMPNAVDAVTGAVK